MSRPVSNSFIPRPYQNDGIRGEKFQLWRISCLTAPLPAEFDTPKHLGNVCVSGEVVGLRTTLDMTEQLTNEGLDVARVTHITLERETKRPKQIAILRAERSVYDDLADTHVQGHGRGFEYFALDDPGSTMPLSEVKQSVRLATRAAFASLVAAMLEDAPIPSSV